MIHLYRVWHNREKKMYYPGTFRLKFNKDSKLHVITNPLRAPTTPKFVTVMQYIGLKDRDGMRVYEGDILFWIHNEHEGIENPDVYVVKYDAPAFVFDIFRNGKVLEHTYRFNSNDIKEFVVAGNIYEMPQLLQEVKQE